MKKTLLTKTLLLLFALIAGSSSSWAEETTTTYTFSAKDWKASPANWTSGKEGGGFSNDGVQVTTNSSGANATSPISFNDISKIVVTYNTNKSAGAGTIKVKVGDNEEKSNNVAYSGSADGRTANFTTQFTFSPKQTGSVKLTVNTTTNSLYICSIAITYTPTSTPSSAVSFDNDAPEVDWPTQTSFTQTATTAAGYTGAVTYSIGSTNTAEATINTTTGALSFNKAGKVMVVANAAAITGFTASSDTYTLTINDVRPAATLSWSEDAVEIMKDAASYTLPTLNNPNSLDVTYTVEGTTGLASVTSAGVVTVNTGTVGTATVKASFAGNNSYKPKTATYTINVVDPTVKGSKYNPYTVSEVISGTATGSNIYVTGYIVGNYNATAPVNPATGDTNFALAEASDETDGAKTIPVELKGTIRNTWGPQTNKVIGYEVQLKGNVDTYFGVSGIKGTSEVTALSIPATIGTSGYTTLGAQYDLDHLKATATGDFDVLEAYVVTAVSTSSVTLETIPHIPAGTGVILKGTPGTTYTIPVFQHGYTVSTNLLKVSDGTITGGDGIYALASKGDPAVVGFYKVAAGVTIPAGKCYLNTAAGAPDFLGFDDNATGIDEVRGKTEEVRGEFYNLAGQRVAQPTKGLYIVNGKKVVMK